MKKFIPTILLVSSCVQHYDPPPIETPSAPEWKAPVEAQTVKAICPEPEKVLDDISISAWWKTFNDPILDNLEDTAIKNSPSVHAAQARLEQAYAAYGIDRSRLFPEIDLGVSASRQRLSQTQSLASGQSTISSSSSNLGLTPRALDSGILPQPVCNCPTPVCPCPPPAKASKTKPLSPYVNQFAILPTLNYELDFWGKNWQAAEAASKQMQASSDALQTALLLVTTAVADTYLQVRTFDAELDILTLTEKTRRSNYDLNREQFTAGLINELPVYQAQSDLESVLSSLEDVKRLRAIAEHALASLVGLPAPLFTLEKESSLPFLPEIPAGLPAETLARRPDIRSQTLLMQAAALNVGVAKTEYFPDFTITMDYGYLSSRSNKLFKWKSHTWLMAVDAITPLFTAGRISSTIKQAIGQYKEQVANYLDTVLVSFQEVEDALFSIAATKNQKKHLHEQVNAATNAYNLADTRYKMGIENYLTVVDTERTMLEARRLETQVLRAQYAATIALIKALGGAW